MNTHSNPLENKELGVDEESLTLESELAAAADEAAEEPQIEQSELDKMKMEAADWKDKYIRLYAEFENFRTRTSREKIALVGTATEDLMVDLLPVVDDFERSLNAIEKATDLSSLKEGVELIFHKMLKVLNQKGLKAMETIGQPFNPDLQEAITQFPVEDPTQKGAVIDEVEKGYQLKEKTIRHAKVVIGA